MRVTFLSHSGFFVELEEADLLFDWWKGELPETAPGKPLLVFASHRHPDHFKPEIFALDDGSRPVRFLLGRDIRLTDRRREKWGVSRETAEKCLFFSGGETAEPLPGVRVEALPSTDEGAAFLTETGGRTLYHAGDLNWWHWAGEDPAWNAGMAANFKEYSEPLRGRRIDLAMFPLDPRLGEDGFLGPRYFLDLTDTRRLLPMHQWEEFAFTERFLERFPQFAETLLPVAGNGQVFDLD